MEQGKRSTVWTVARIVGLAALVCLVPTVRTCGDVALGFLTVAVSNLGDQDGEIRWFNLGINVLVVGLAVIGLIVLYKKPKSDEARTRLRWGFGALALYQLFIVFGYVVVYPILMKSGDATIGSCLSMGYAYFIYPFFSLIGPVSRLLPPAWQESPLFGDSSDIPMRLGWLAMGVAWFGAGAGARAILDSTRARRARRAGGDA